MRGKQREIGRWKRSQQAILWGSRRATYVHRGAPVFCLVTSILCRMTKCALAFAHERSAWDGSSTPQKRYLFLARAVDGRASHCPSRKKSRARVGQRTDYIGDVIEHQSTK
jgi:hypothetical protein